MCVFLLTKTLLQHMHMCAFLSLTLVKIAKIAQTCNIDCICSAMNPLTMSEAYVGCKKHLLA